MKKYVSILVMLVFILNSVSFANHSSDKKLLASYRSLINSKIKSENIDYQEVQKQLESSMDQVLKNIDNISDVAYESAIEKLKQENNYISLENLTAYDKAFLLSKIDEELIMSTLSEVEAINLALKAELKQENENTVNALLILGKSGFKNEILKFNEIVKSKKFDSRFIPIIIFGVVLMALSIYLFWAASYIISTLALFPAYKSMGVISVLGIIPAEFSLGTAYVMNGFAIASMVIGASSVGFGATSTAWGFADK